MYHPILVAVDLGAESCRVSLLTWPRGTPEIRIVSRFPNGPVSGPNGLHWDIKAICGGIEKGLRRCADLIDAKQITAVAVDGWAADYVRLRADGTPLADPFCYRDERTVEAEKRVHNLISRERLYDLTGVQLLRFNTVYQLFADRLSGIDQCAPWVNLPEYLASWLGGRRVSEYTNATHTQLVSKGAQDWCREVFDTLNLKVADAPPIVQSGSIVGKIAGHLASSSVFRDTLVVVPASHDTASAVAGIPADGDDWAFISSGTWSLVGTVLPAPCTTEMARRGNFTNLGAAGGKICFLKNVNGMWILQRCLDEWRLQGQDWAINELVSGCAALPAPDHLINVGDPELLLPGNMLGRINAQRECAGYEPLRSDPAGVLNCTNVVLHSLAAQYATILSDIAAITGKQLERVFIVGGGRRNDVLNRLTAERTGLQVSLGSPESATLGNFAVQLAALENGANATSRINHSEVTRWARVLKSAIATNEHPNCRPEPTFATKGYQR